MALAKWVLMIRSRNLPDSPDRPHSSLFCHKRKFPFLLVRRARLASSSPALPRLALPPTGSAKGKELETNCSSTAVVDFQSLAGKIFVAHQPRRYHTSRTNRSSRYIGHSMGRRSTTTPVLLQKSWLVYQTHLLHLLHHPKEEDRRRRLAQRYPHPHPRSLFTPNSYLLHLITWRRGWLRTTVWMASPFISILMLYPEHLTNLWKLGFIHV